MRGVPVFTAYVVIAMITAIANIYAAWTDFSTPEWLLANMNRLGVSRRWLRPLGIAKALGAIGLLAGIFMPAIGIAAAAGLVFFFVCAMATAVRARWYGHLPFPAVWLLLAATSLALRVVAG
jgi:hypothetical protein